MKIKDLSAPVTASKADWLPGTTWLGFTPKGKGPNAAAQCASTIQKQFADGYVLERITDKFDNPNPGFENDPQIVAEREEHEKVKDGLLAIHRLRHSMRPLEDIIGKAEYDHLQDMWSGDNQRRRWSVAFPIVETYEIVGHPKARDVFPQELFRRIYQQQSATLRILDDEARAAIANLEIIRSDAPNAWIAIEDEIAMAERSTFRKSDERNIGNDLASALEGETEERRTKLKKRATWLANKFAIHRRDAGTLFCDDCGFDPSHRTDLIGIKPRSCLDVHHKHPLAEGQRRTNLDDFALLCPTCHRLEHLRLKISERRSITMISPQEDKTS